MATMEKLGYLKTWALSVLIYVFGLNAFIFLRLNSLYICKIDFFKRETMNDENGMSDVREQQCHF